MAEYSAHEYTDMIITYGASGGNSSAASRLYAERFPGRERHPDCNVILRCIQRLRETGSMFISRRHNVVKIHYRTEEKILRAFEDSPRNSVRRIARSFGVSRNSVYRILDRNGLIPYRFQRDEKQRDICEDISNASAIEKSTGKENKITIANDKDRLSKEDIERTVNEAEKYRSEDEQQQERISVRNALESYCFNMKSTMEDTIKNKIDASDKKKVLFKCNEVISWLDANQLAEKEKYVDKQKELEAICNLIVTKLYQSDGAPGDFPDASRAESNLGAGSTIEEVD